MEKYPESGRGQEDVPVGDDAAAAVVVVVVVL